MAKKKKSTKKKAATRGKGKSKTTTKKVAKSKASAAKGTRSAKKPTKKKISKAKGSKKTTRKPAKKKVTKKTTKKKTPRKTAVKKTSAAVKSAKKSAKKTAGKKTAGKKTAAKNTAGKKTRAKKSTTQKTRSKATGRSKPASFNGSAKSLGDIHGNGHQQLTDAQLRKVKTGLTKKDLKYFQQLLLEKRAEIVGDVAAMGISRNGGGELSHMPLHMADIGSDNYEQEFTLGLVESERKLLYEIDEALLRIANRTYGACIVSGKPIRKARLEVQPWAKYCIEVARERERRM